MSPTFAKCNCTHFHSDKAGPYGNQPKTKTKFVLVTSPEVPKTKFVLVIRTENQNEFVFSVYNRLNSFSFSYWLTVEARNRKIAKMKTNPFSFSFWRQS